MIALRRLRASCSKIPCERGSRGIYAVQADAFSSRRVFFPFAQDARAFSVPICSWRRERPVCRRRALSPSRPVALVPVALGKIAQFRLSGFARAVLPTDDLPMASDAFIHVGFNVVLTSGASS